MAYLQPPLTIISSNEPSPQTRSKQQHSFHHCHDETQTFRLPAATWFDEDQNHFVALEERISSTADASVTGGGDGGGSLISGLESLITTNTNDTKESDDEEEEFEIVRYQAFGLPRHNNNHHSDQKKKSGGHHHRSGSSNSSSSEEGIALDVSERINNLSAFESAAKKAARANKKKSLVTEIAVTFTLPASLANIVNRGEDASSAGPDDGDDDTTAMLTRRIPILAKFSPMVNGLRYLALQYTPTMIRIATVEGIDQEQNDEKHWTIDLTYDVNPVATTSKQLPNFLHQGGGGSTRNLFHKNKENEGIIIGTTSIIGGGIIWCQRMNNVLDLIVVTTTSVIMYSINNGQMTKTQVVVQEDPAASFWYESQSKTLVVGSYTSNLPRGLSESISEGMISSERISASSPTVTFPIAVMSMKTLFFKNDSPTFQTLPTFAVGTLREKKENDEGGKDEHVSPSQQGRDGSDNITNDDRSTAGVENVILPSEVSLFSLYGSLYCVEIGSLGDGQGIGLTELDSDSSCIRVRQHNIENLTMDHESVSVGVIDNLLFITSRDKNVTHFIDVADIFFDDKRVFRESIGVTELVEEGDKMSIYNEKLSFLAPSYFLNTDGQGLLYQVGISLPTLVRSAPPKACIIPFLLRRNAAKDTVRRFIMERFAALIEARDLATLKQWLGVITKQYTKNKRALQWDNESTVSLLSKSMLDVDSAADVDKMCTAGEVMVPDSSCIETLTQTEMLQMILLPHAMVAVKEGKNENLRFLSSLSVHYLVELERQQLSPCVALEMLVITLLLKTGETDELASFLSCRQTQRTITRRRRQLDLPTTNRLYSEIPGAAALGETLFVIAKNLEPELPPPIKMQLISFATIILQECGAANVAVKCLLSAGQINNAIAICSKRSKVHKGADEENKVAGAQAKDFFRVAAKIAKEQNEAERCSSFYHLHCFLKQYDPSCFSLDKRKMKVHRIGDEKKATFRKDYSTVVVEQSVLAHETRFPDELFGSLSCRKLRTMFGYALSVN